MGNNYDRGQRTFSYLYSRWGNRSQQNASQGGPVPLSQASAKLLFEMLSQRYKRGSTLVTSNLPFQE